MTGRILWSSTSDLIGRKNIYRVYLGVGALMYLRSPSSAMTPNRCSSSARW
ncbi:hypothetical protein QFZ67_006487 [Streptomyces sp. V1I1]|nr:hypothetical protein [Streptomyces sp. V1I1]